MATQNYQLINGDSLNILKQFPDNHFDSVVCDPPYGISFLGKDWDSKKATTSTLVGVQNLPSGMKHTSLADDLAFQHWLTEIYKECLRVLKPGGYLLSFAAARMSHHNAMAAQMAGFEIRDQIMWIYASGFPKSQDVGKSIERSEGKKRERPDAIRYEGSDEVIDGHFGSQHGKCGKCGKDVVAAKILGQNQSCPEEGCGYNEIYRPAVNEWAGWGNSLKPAHEPICMARKPLKQTIAKNCQQYGTGAINIDAGRIAYNNDKPKSQLMPTIQSAIGGGDANVVSNLMSEVNDKGRFPSNVIGDIEGYQKFFYQPKVSRKERHCGFDEIPYNGNSEVGGMYGENQAAARKNTSEKGNNHPTVKPVALMDYLIRLVTKPGGKVLDPFNGSGSTGMAAVKAGYEYVGIDLDPKYIEISRKRIDAWCKEEPQGTNYDELFTEEGDE